jgi:hypothetical protein
MENIFPEKYVTKIVYYRDFVVKSAGKTTVALNNGNAKMVDVLDQCLPILQYLHCVEE